MIMVDKRPYGGDGDAPGGVKKPRSSNNGSPAPATNGGPPAKISIEEQIARAKAKAAELTRGRLGAAGNLSSVPSTTLSPADAARKKIEDMKQRIAEAAARATQRPQTPLHGTQPAQTEDGFTKARGGLGIGLHPALMGDGIPDTRGLAKSSTSSRFSTTIGNRRAESPVLLSGQNGKKQLDLSGPSLEELKKNPYYDASLGVTAGLVPRERKSRELIFHQKGKFIAQAAALRRQAHLEEMRRRIAESARKAGLEEDRSEQAFVVPQPPEIEWWDEGLVEGTAYPDFDDDAVAAEQKLKITTEDTVITRYVQHPVLLQPPQEKKYPAPKPMFMTKIEQAKKRRQDRMEVLKEKQAKVRLGLEPPEPPKIKKSNLMRVLGEQAVKDPTAVEARVNREIAERREKHEKSNEERKLTKEERAEKLEKNQEQDAARGIYMNVFRVESMAYGKHRYQVDVNAKQHALTGVTIFNPKLNLVIVEGGEHSIKQFRKLMLNRMRWTEIAPNIHADNSKDKDIAEAEWLQPVDEKGVLKDQSGNRCVLIWEGEIKQRAFKKWATRVCATDGEARRALERSKMENMWQSAKNWSG